MTGDRWPKVEELFHAAVALPGHERQRFLDQACGGDAVLRQDVESLLGFSDTPQSVIDTPALDVAARLMAGDLSASMVPLTGTVIGHLRVGPQIGEGGMGVVYEAEDTRLGRLVALKFLSPRIAARPRARERFEREARAASALNHPNICTIHSVQEHDGRPFIEMERLEGEPLRERVARGAMPADDVMRIARDLADALAAAHDKGIIHRDLTPANVFCTARGAKILDFGIASIDPLSEDARAVIGTPAYMAPEQRDGQPLDARADLFSLGAVMLEMATGQPFEGAPAAALPATLEPIVGRLLQRDRERRYSSATELKRDLERALTPVAQRRRWRWVAAAALTTAAGAAILWSIAFDGRAGFGSNLKLRQVTHNAGEFTVGSGAISPDGRFVAYTDPRGVHLLLLDNNDTRRLPFDEAMADAWDVAPGWLNDLTFVVNAHRRNATPRDTIWMAGLDNARRRLRDDAVALSVSPDGAWIAFRAATDWPHTRSLWLMDREGGNARKLFDAESGSAILEVSWSPDSKRIAYGKADATGASIAIETRDLMGGSASMVVRPDASESLQGSAWLRDGRLFYSVTQPLLGTNAGTTPCSHWQLRVGNDGRALGAPRPLAGWLPQCVAALSFTRDSTRALYRQYGVQDTIRIAPLAESSAELSRRLTVTEGRNIPSGWTRDGRSVVYVSDSGGRAALVRQDLDADVAERLTDEPGIVGAARLTPDGETILFLVSDGRRRSSAQRLHSIPVRGGVSKEIAKGAFVEGARCATLPSQLCAIAERQDHDRTLAFFAIDPDRGRGAELLRVSADPAGEYRWALSASGTEIALVEESRPVVQFITIAGGSTRTAAVSGTQRLGYVSWLPDGSGVLVPGFDGSGARLLAVDREGRMQTVFHQADAIDISGIPSPDGSRVAVWIRTRNASLWLAESP